MDFKSKFDEISPESEPSREKIKSILKKYWSVPVSQIERLDGGYSHFNYRFTDSHQRTCVLRPSSKLEELFLTEMNLIKKLSGFIPVPQIFKVVVGLDELSGGHIVLMEYIEGDLLCNIEDDLTPVEINQIGTDLGRSLAKLHGVQFERAGFLGPDIRVKEFFKESFICETLKFLDTALANPQVVKRLDQKTIEAVKTYIVRQAKTLDQVEERPCLVHSDFNSKNIIVKKENNIWQLKAILDWEFSFVGSSLVDLGNFFRFSKEQEIDYKNSLVSSYKTFGGLLPDKWEELAKFFDLLSLLQFLMKHEEQPLTFRSVKKLLVNYTQSK